MESLLNTIRYNLNCNFNDIQSFINFVEYHNLHHYFEQNTNLTPNQKEVLTNLYRKKKLHNLALLDEWTKIINTNHNRCQLFLYKGIHLSKQLFNDPIIRPTRDIDIWVNKNDVLTAEQVLTECGYVRIKPNFKITTVELKHIFKHIHHFTYLNQRNIVVELHWNLLTPRFLFKDGEQVFQTVQNNHNMEPFPSEWLLHFLIIHGSKHLWNRLIWLYDISCLLKTQTIDWKRFYSFRQSYHNERMVNVCFFLVKELFKTEIPDTSKLNKTENNIAKICLESIIGQGNYLRQDNINKFKRAYYRSLFIPGIKKIHLWLAGSTTQDDWERLRLPARLFWLYYLLHPFLWVATSLKSKKNYTNVNTINYKKK